jgi:hypothetical protein
LHSRIHLRRLELLLLLDLFVLVFFPLDLFVLVFFPLDLFVLVFFPLDLFVVFFPPNVGAWEGDSLGDALGGRLGVEDGGMLKLSIEFASILGQKTSSSC